MAKIDRHHAEVAADCELLKTYCTTPLQVDRLQMIIDAGGNQSKAGRDNGLTREVMKKVYTDAKRRRAKLGQEPRTADKPVVEGFEAKRISTYRDGEGNVLGEWLIQEQDKAQAQLAIVEAIDNACMGLPRIKPTKPPKHTNADLATLYTITDFHLGMYAWAAEGGEDWDMRIAEKVLINAIHDMMEGSPDSEVGIFLQLGDFLHWDGLLAVTPQNNHVLDADTRYGRLVELTLKVSRQVVDMLLEKHKRVVVFNCEGNHDQAGSVWLRKTMCAFYENEPRAEIDDTEFPYYAYLHGRTMLAFHHGHYTKIKGLPALFASEPRFREMWGAANYTYIHTGHLHHVDTKPSEDGGAITVRHPTLSARDAYTARSGYTAHRSASAITYDKVRGKVSEAVVYPRWEE